MSVSIQSLGVALTGSVTRKFDGKTTTLILTGEQARELHAALGEVVGFFDAQCCKLVADLPVISQ